MIGGSRLSAADLCPDRPDLLKAMAAQHFSGK